MKELTRKEMLETTGGFWEKLGEYAGWKALETGVKLGNELRKDATKVSGDRYGDKDYRESKRDRREGRGGRSHERSRGGRGERHAGDSGRDNR